jgi:hypothetical protein
LIVEANTSRYTLSGTSSMSEAEPRTVEQWANETARFVRITSDNQTNYRVIERHQDLVDMVSRTEGFLSAGSFEVRNESSGNGTVVLAAEGLSADTDALSDVDSFEGRLIVTETGRIQRLSVTATEDGETMTYHYQLREESVESVSKPDWMADVPPGAAVQPQLSFDVADDSYLVLEHTGGDTVPSETAVTIESNETTDTARLDESLSAGETRYLYFSKPTGSLQLTAEQPAPDSVSPVTSPVSVRVVTDGGAVLHNGGFAWSSESTSADHGNGASDSTQSEGGDKSSGQSSG